MWYNGGRGGGWRGGGINVTPRFVIRACMTLEDQIEIIDNLSAFGFKGFN